MKNLNTWIQYQWWGR